MTDQTMPAPHPSRVGEHGQDPAMHGAGGVVELRLELDRHRAAVRPELQDAELEETPDGVSAEPLLEGRGHFGIGTHVARNISAWSWSLSS